MGDGIFGWRRGEPTGDIELALAVLESYWSGELAETYPTDIGNQTRKALDYLKRHHETLSLPKDPEAQSNGAVMRPAPHSVMARNPEEAFENAFAEAGLTHPSWEARTSAALVAWIVTHLVEGSSPAEVLESDYSLTEDDGRDRDAWRVFAPL